MGHIPGKACSQDCGLKRNQNLGYEGKETEVEGNREQNLPEGKGRGSEVLFTGAPAWMIVSNMGKSLPMNTQALNWHSDPQKKQQLPGIIPIPSSLEGKNLLDPNEDSDLPCLSPRWCLIFRILQLPGARAW